MKYKIYKVNKENLATLKEWGTVLMNQFLKDALSSLQQENCIHESVHLFYINDEPYLCALMVPEQGKSIVKGPDSDLNLKHREIFKSAILEEVPIDTLYSLSID